VFVNAVAGRKSPYFYIAVIGRLMPDYVRAVVCSLVNAVNGLPTSFGMAEPNPIF
jgi:hypothetical protein